MALSESRGSTDWEGCQEECNSESERIGPKLDAPVRVNGRDKASHFQGPCLNIGDAYDVSAWSHCSKQCSFGAPDARLGLSSVRTTRENRRSSRAAHLIRCDVSWDLSQKPATHPNPMMIKAHFTLRAACMMCFFLKTV